MFQAQIKTGQDIGYALLFMMSAALVEVQQLLHWPTLLRWRCWCSRCASASPGVALIGSDAWSAHKKNAMALSMCSLVSFGTLVVDNSLGALPRPGRRRQRR